ncbi:hypothetical protein GCM10022224_031840 [Nonomuraea antimicrobica]|uniref:Uncharacterized protein n=1 Tax=Nonomuraea antimicrobica TaxID=561173 RepID=A0ABP7BPH3_9ACTN
MEELASAYGNPVLGAFDLDFFDGERRLRTRLGDGWSVRFEHGRPVRGFRWAKGGRGFAGWHWSSTTSDHIGYESWLERDRLILLVRLRSRCLGHSSSIQPCRNSGRYSSWPAQRAACSRITLR